jgi:hypothetical protein
MSSLSSPTQVCERVSCPCVRHGLPGNREVVAVFQDYGPPDLPTLYVFSEWSTREGGWMKRREFKVAEIPCGMSGRAFILHRTPEAIAADPHGDERYGVLIGFEAQGDLCECKGHQARGYCVHTAAMRWVVTSGNADADPLHDPRPEPTPKQMAEAPF